MPRGQRLLIRSPRGIEPTRAGRILVRRAEAVEHQLELASAEIGLDAHGIAGPLRIAGTPGALISVVPATLALLSTTHPCVSISVQEASDGDLLSLLRLGSVDLTIGTLGFESLQDDVLEIELLEDSFGLIVPANHSLQGDSVDLQDVLQEPWVLPNHLGAFRRQVDAIFITHKLSTPTRLIRCDSLATTRELVLQARHVTLLPRRVVAAELAAGTLRIIALRTPIYRKLGFRLLAANFAAPLLGSFVDAAKATVTA
jgi:LysR family transcriptional regulator of abg operon